MWKFRIPKSWNDVIITSSLCFCNPSVKLDPDTTALKLCRLIAFGKFRKIRKFENHIDKKWRYDDVITKNNRKNTDVREISQTIHQSKGLDQSYPKLQVLSNLSNFVKSYGHLSEILAFLPQALTKYG